MTGGENIEIKGPTRFKTLNLNIGYRCNNNCVFCYEGNGSENIPREKKSFEDIKKDLEAAAGEFDMVTFIGAEPTLRDDFVDILKLTESLGFKRYCFATNGRQFKDYEFAKAVAFSGVNTIAISLTGGTAETHDKETRSPGSFDDLVAGLKNIVPFSRPGFTPFVNFTMNRGNYRDLDLVLDLVEQIGVKEVNIRNTMPLSLRTIGSKEVIMKMSEISEYIGSVLKKRGLLDANKFPFIFYLQDFLPCTLVPEARIHVLPNKVDSHAYIRIPLCKNCEYQECPGILENYADIYGTEEFRF